MLRHPSRSRVSRLASRLLAGAAVGVLVAGLASGPALAEEPTPTTTGSAGGGSGDTSYLVGPQTAGTAGCALPAEQDEVTGIAVTPAGTGLIEGTDTDQVMITTLDTSCAPEPENWSDGANPRSPQDLLFSDGAFYICDCGDAETRTSIAMEKVVPGGAGWEIYRFTFPSGTTLNAKAMLLVGGLPIFFATDATGVTGVFTAAALPAENDTTGAPLTKATDWTAMETGTPTPVAGGESTVTGAAISPDGTRVVIRTYSDAYEYAVSGGDIVTAIQGTPIGVTPLPNETKGEAITYATDGEQFITASGGATLLTYQRFEAPDEPVVTETPTTPPDEGDGGLLSRFSVSELTKIIGAVGVVGIVLAIAGIIGIRRARRRREDDWDDDYDDDDDDDYDDRRSRRSRRGRGRGDDYDSREMPAYSGSGYDSYAGDAAYGQDYTGYQPGYADQGYGQEYTGGYQQGYGGQPGYDQGYADPSYGGQPGYGTDPGYGGQGYDQGYGDYGGRQGYR